MWREFLSWFAKCNAAPQGQDRSVDMAVASNEGHGGKHASCLRALAPKA